VRFKLKKNVPIELADMFREAGHDAVTVLDQNLMGAQDSDLASVCMREGRAIVTLDTDFADIRTYPPDAYPGLVVFRLSAQARDHVLEIGTRLLKVLSGTTVSGQLWIVEESRIRVRQ
jgi:predicted nuclease of predicted toxin-antitoxin system